ncbi:hypothetical protein MRB53_028423 [Persea americana]|uniref:Uncharacterized protein n=1 Tax=Persea americana TaxID=3435 RepID=A0ACC2KFI6_PERAE|nr:hypothetical protein MRB53_028423 [Persea americana]
MEGKKSGGRRSTIEDLTDDLIMEILRHLPLSSFIRCLVVCKRWQYLIACSPLLHTNTINVAASYDGFNENYMCLERGQRGGMQQIFSELDFSVNFPNKRRYHNRILTSCNGLLFSYYSVRRRNHSPLSYISNPWTKECVCIPNPSLTSRFYLCGLAFENNSSSDNNNNKLAMYKIVMAHRAKEEHYKFEIYSSDKKRWQWVSNASELEPHGDCRFDQNGVYCNQVLYWQCHWKRHQHALTFNLETETSSYLGLPIDDDGNLETLFSHKLMECDQQLHYIQTGVVHCRLIIWKMLTSGEWLMMHKVDLKGAVERNLGLFPFHRTGRGFPYFRPIGMSVEQDNKVLLSHFDKLIVSYDLKKCVFELVLPSDFKPLYYFFRYSPTTKFITER